jgi:hypothetical protein
LPANMVAALKIQTKILKNLIIFLVLTKAKVYNLVPLGKI